MTQIMAVPEPENCCRMSLRQSPKKSALAIRIAMAASATVGNGWVSVAQIQSTLVGVGKSMHNLDLAKLLESYGIAERRLTCIRGRPTNEIKFYQVATWGCDHKRAGPSGASWSSPEA